jgi:hypothetical protein
MKRRRDMTVFSGNRANQHSLTREFESSIENLQKLIPVKHTKLNILIEEIQAKISLSIQSVSPESFHELGVLHEQFENAKKEIQTLDTEVESKQRQFKSLISFNSVEALVFSNRLLNRPPELFPVEVDKCSCGKLFVFDETESTNICKTCNVVESVLFHIDDNSADTLILRLPVSGTAAITQPESLIKAGLLPIATKRIGRSSSFIRSTNYRKFLVQFTTCVSDEVISYIHSLHNRTVHSHADSLCRSTRFASFLRESIKFSGKHNEATTITICFLNGQSKLLSFDLVDRLVKRFEKYRTVISDIMPDKEAKKCAAFEFLTNRFLILEGEVQLSRSFELPKTRTVLRCVNKRFVNICKILKWKIPRSI